MRRLLIVTTTALVFLLLATAPALAKNEKSKSDSNSRGKLVLNVTYKVTDLADTDPSGEPLTDDVNRHVQVRQTADGSYYVIVKDQGRWQAIETAIDPDETFVEDQTVDETAGDHDSGMSGTLHGGYTATFEAGEPVDLKNGHLGTFSYESAPEGDQLGADLPAPFNWMDTFFPESSGLNYLNWTYTYIFQSERWTTETPGSPLDVPIPESPTGEEPSLPEVTP